MPCHVSNFDTQIISILTVLTKPFAHAVFAELRSKRFEIVGLRTSDVSIGVFALMIGTRAISNSLVDKVVHISDSLIVGISENRNCNSKPGLHTCSDPQVWCGRYGKKVSIDLCAQWAMNKIAKICVILSRLVCTLDTTNVNLPFI
jgi:hypothetical protein